MSPHLPVFDKHPLTRWQDCRLADFNSVPASYRHWLLDRGSLTRALQALSEGDFRVEVLSRRWEQPRDHERQVLGMSHRQVAMIREVILYGKGQPWVYARTVMPASSLSGRLGFLKMLGSKPLGALLFRDPTMRRGPIQVAKVESTNLPGALPDNARGPAWGRRSVFYLAGKPLLVSEVFLSTFSGK